MTTKLHSQIDEMRARLAENAAGEQTLLRALSEALEHVDRQLIDEVRQVTAGHEARRVAILAELQVLASRLCTFPVTAAPRTPLAANDAVHDLAPPARHDLAPPARHDLAPPARHDLAPRAHQNGMHAPGDWRRAASNIDDDLDLYREDARRAG